MFRHTLSGLLGAAVTLAAGGAWAQDHDAPRPSPAAPAVGAYVIHAGHLLAEPGKPMEANKSILVENGRVVAIRDGFVPGANVIDLSHSYVLPGLINMHTHMALPGLQANTTWRLQRPEVVMLATIPKLKAMLEEGFTTIRDLGDESSIMYELAGATQSGVIEGPRILASEPFFGIGNGYTSAYSSGLRAELEPFYVNRGACVSRDQCRNAVREEVRRGAQVIKIRLSYLPAIDPSIESVETVDEIKWIVDMAHELHRTVAVHTVVGAKTETPAHNAIAAGADTIEHGPISTDDIALMKKMGTSYVPTLAVAHNSEAGYPGLYERIHASAVALHKAGIRFGFGTDFPLIPMDQTYTEFLEMQEAGLTPMEALQTATVNAAAILQRSDEIGSIGPGKAADIIAVDGDPLADLHVMGKVSFVMKGGKVVRSAP